MFPNKKYWEQSMNHFSEEKLIQVEWFRIKVCNYSKHWSILFLVEGKKHPLLPWPQLILIHLLFLFTFLLGTSKENRFLEEEITVIDGNANVLFKWSKN